MISRRTLLAGALGAVAGAGVLGAAGCANPSAGQTAVLLNSAATLPARFVTPFAVPPVKRPVARTAGRTTYEITQRRARVSILPGPTTEIMGYDGLFPGPTIRSRRGERLRITHRNELDVPTVVHLHGGHTPAASDGFPTDLVIQAVVMDHGGPMDHGGGHVAQGRRHYDYPNDQPAATLWYHDHRMDFTGPQVWRGMAGLHLITDDVEDALPLPHGDRDLPLMIMDRSFDADGSLRYPSLDPMLMAPPGVTPAFMSGVLGDVVLVNGRPWPVLEVEAVRYRFRILNASNARRYRLGLDPAPPSGPAFTQVGSDGGLLAAPVDHAQIDVAAAERFDVVVDFGAYPVGTEITLTNGLGVGSTDAVMRFVVARAGRDDARVPARLAEIEPLVPPPGATVREWRFTRGRADTADWVINGRPFDPERVDAGPPLGEIEIWRFATDVHHPVHVHLSPFQVLHRGDRGPGRYDGGWKDTIDLTPTEYADVAVRFTDHVGRYVLHCHNLEHEDMMMMAAFATRA